MQFVEFQKYKDNDHTLAKEILAEIPRQIKEYFEGKGIIPRDFKSS